MAGVISTGSFPKALWPGVNQNWGMAYDEYQPQWKEVFEMWTSDKNYEEDVSMTGMGLASKKDEGAALKYDSMKQAYVTRYPNIAYATGFAITREEIADNLYPEIGRARARNAAFVVHQTTENIGANVFNRAFNPFYPLGDGVSLINSAHPTEGGTLSNTLPIQVDLAEAPLEDILINISQARDNRNNLIQIKERCLLVPPQLKFTAQRILGNPERPGTADRDINAMYSMGMLPDGFKVNNYLTDNDAWFVITNCQNGLKYFEREAVKFEQDNDFGTKNALFSAYIRFSFGASDWRSVWGSSGH